LIPNTWIQELSKLQDQVPNFSFAQVEETIRDELGSKFNEIDQIIFDPVGSASLAQVHRATLKDGKIISANKIIVCSGIWSKRLLKTINHKVNIEAERGFHIVLKKVNFLPPNPLMIISKKIAITPMENTLRFAGIVDFSGVDAPANKSRYDYIRSLIKNIIPSLSWKEENLWMGQRPSTSDSLPVLG